MAVEGFGGQFRKTMPGKGAPGDFFHLVAKFNLAGKGGIPKHSLKTRNSQAAA